MSELISDETDKANSPSIPSADAASCAWVEGLLRPPPPRRLRDALLFGGGIGGAGIEIDLGVGAGVSSCWGLGTAGRSDVVDADRVRLIEALEITSQFGERYRYNENKGDERVFRASFSLFLCSSRARSSLVKVCLTIDASIDRARG